MNKYFTATKINILTLLSTFLNLFELIKTIFIRLFCSTEKTIYLFLFVIWIFGGFTAFFLQDTTIDRFGMIIYIAIIAVIIWGFLYKFFYYAKWILEFLLNIVNLEKMIYFLNDHLINEINKLFEENIDTTKSNKLSLLPAYAIYIFCEAFTKGFKLIKIFVYPLAGIYATWFAYNTIFIQSEAPVLGDKDFIPSAVLVFVLAGMGIYITKTVVTLIEESIYDTDFNLINILRYCFRQSTYENKQNFSQNEPHTNSNESPIGNNPYYNYLFSSSSAEELKKRYREKTKEIHPDNNNGNNTEFFTKEMAHLNEAYDYLSKYKFRQSKQ